MGLTKKLQKFGSSYGVLFPVDVVAQLGINPEVEEDRVLSFEVYGESLVIRRKNAPRPTLQEIALYLGADLEDAAKFPKRLEIDSVPEDLRPVVELLSFSPRTAFEVSKSLAISKEAAEKKLNRAISKQLIVKEGKKFRLNQTLFQE